MLPFLSDLRVNSPDNVRAGKRKTVEDEEKPARNGGSGRTAISLPEGPARKNLYHREGIGSRPFSPDRKAPFC